MATIGGDLRPYGEPVVAASQRTCCRPPPSGIHHEKGPRHYCQAGAGQKISTGTSKAPRNGAVRGLGKTVRLRDKEHRKFVSRQACLVCGRTPSDPHHLRFLQPRALGRRVSDEFTVPLCRIHHRELHRQGDEAAWWDKLSIDPVPVALKLWQHTRLNGTAFPASGGAELGSATATQDSQQGRAGTSRDPGIDAGSSNSKNTDGVTSQ
jgi:hypothetical protein